jgi:hypothetical protein
VRIAAFTAARNASATSSLRDESLEESANLPDLDVLAQKIVEDLEAALEQFREIASDLNAKNLREVPRQ